MSDTIVYLALSIASNFVEDRTPLIEGFVQHLPTVEDWTQAKYVLPHLSQMANALDQFFVQHLSLQKPMVLQPIWKTEGKRLTLHENAFDVFVWSDFAFTRLFFREVATGLTISRGKRSIVWLTRLLTEFASTGAMDYKRIIDQLSYNTKNDKAFAVSAAISRLYMQSAELQTPRIRRSELRNIILGGGEKYLSPERRLDAAIANTPDSFE